MSWRVELVRGAVRKQQSRPTEHQARALFEQLKAELWRQPPTSLRLSVIEPTGERVIDEAERVGVRDRSRRRLPFPTAPRPVLEQQARAYLIEVLRLLSARSQRPWERAELRRAAECPPEACQLGRDLFAARVAHQAPLGVSDEAREKWLSFHRRRLMEELLSDLG